MSIDVAAQTMITYEQPLNEHVRLYLRIENLFKQLFENIDQPNTTSNKIAMQMLLKLANVTDRPDIKSKMTQTLTQQTSTLTQLLEVAEVDKTRLRNVLDQLDLHITALHQSHSRIGDRIRKNEFLNQIRSQLTHPGGACQNNTPAYALWLSTPTEERVKDLKEWAEEFMELHKISGLILKLLRDSTMAEKLHCKDGFYQKTLDSSTPCELIRVTVPTCYSLYPEISAGKHRIIVRFLHPNYYEGGRAEQSHKDFDFYLACCRI
ncbi:MAG: cell division protein ZapD [Gammaproteobacteria bacterium]|nr:cell division protein ZapD [Gammaproteobacteria bacterium]MCH9744749.1 cell division protein ZapD [Gammaproteobacteria bacterium]